MSFEPPVSPSLLEQNKSKTKHKTTENQTERNETKQTMWNVAVGAERVSVSVCECVWDAGEAIKSNPF